jgi:hypothetical protein
MREGLYSTIDCQHFKIRRKLKRKRAKSPRWVALASFDSLSLNDIDAAKKRDIRLSIRVRFSPMAFATAGMVAAIVLIAGMAGSILLAVVKKH